MSSQVLIKKSGQVKASFKSTADNASRSQPNPSTSRSTALSPPVAKHKTTCKYLKQIQS